MRLPGGARGVTIVEAMMAAAIIGVVGAGGTALYLSTYRMYAIAKAQTDITQVATSTLTNLSKYLRQISQAPGMTAGATLHPTAASPVTFYLPLPANPAVRSVDDQIQLYLGTWNGRSNVLVQRLIRGGVTYNPVPVLIDFDHYRNNIGTFNTLAIGGIGAVLGDANFRYEDFAVYFDSAYRLISVGVTVSTADRTGPTSRRSISLHTSIAIRNTY